MGGGGIPQPNIVGGGQTPVAVPPFGAQPQSPNPFFMPANSMKGGDLAGLPGLQETFNRPLGGPAMFPNSQAFPQPPLVPPGGPGGVPAPNLPRIVPDVPATQAPRPLPMPVPEYEREIQGGG